VDLARWHVWGATADGAPLINWTFIVTNGASGKTFSRWRRERRHKVTPTDNHHRRGSHELVFVAGAAASFACVVVAVFAKAQTRVFQD